MCKGFHHCPSPWWWECSIRNRQLGDKQVDRTNYTNTNTTSGRRASAVNTWKRQKASGSTGQIGMFQLLEWPSGWGRALSKTCHFISFSTPVAPVWKELAVSLPAKGRFFFVWWGWDYITPIRNKRPIGPRTVKGFKNQNNVAQFSRKEKRKKKKRGGGGGMHCFKVKLGKPAVYRILPRAVRDWNNVGEFTGSAKSWRYHLFSTHCHN